MNKRGSAWIWILLIIILIIIGLVIYFQFFSGGTSSGISGIGSSIPKPPALPS